MADLVDDLVLFPHCDVHIVLNLPSGISPFALRVFRRKERPTEPGRYELKPVTNAEYEFIAPHRATGRRFDSPGLPTVADPATGVVTATVPGVYLFQIRNGRDYIVGRLQVHTEIENWWFGNDSITTALDLQLGHAQPTIYAKFTDEPTGTDLVGDITGHGYVELTSNTPQNVVIVAEGRLRGVAPTTDPSGSDVPGLITGKFGSFPPRVLPVRVIDYGVVRPNLVDHLRGNVSAPEQMQNILLLSEGFTKADEARFTKIASDLSSLLFSTQRNQPYGLLKHRFNVLSRFTASQERGITLGLRVTDQKAGEIGSGFPIPFNGLENTRKPKLYPMSDLVARVGLPQRNESRTGLIGIWGEQSLYDFQAQRVDTALVEAWKKHQSRGMLHTRDTVFGVLVGGRMADRNSRNSDEVARPADDTPGPQLAAFIKRVYEFYQMPKNRAMGLDPRRHPPELYALGRPNPATSIMRFVAGLRFTDGSGAVHDIGKEWVLDPAAFKRSRGLIAIVALDDLQGGTNINAKSMVLVTVNKNWGVAVKRGGPGTVDPEEMRRLLPKVTDSLGKTVDTIAHEFGHTFNLADEYETFGGDQPDSADPSLDDLTNDNVSKLKYLRIGGELSRDIDAGKVKWFALHCMRLSARLVADSRNVAPGLIEVSIGTADIDKWQKSTRVDLQNFDPKTVGRQLPLKVHHGEPLIDLTIVDVAPTRGVLLLTRSNLPAPPPIFKTGSAVFAPLLDDHGDRILVVRKSVLNYVNAQKKPLNLDEIRAIPKIGTDVPVRIPGQQRPSRPSTMIGIYEGADNWAGGRYRPAGTCKMRSLDELGVYGEFCFVCKWLIVNRVDPNVHAELHRRFYPEGKHD